MIVKRVVTVCNQFGKKVFVTKMNFSFLKSIYGIDAEINRVINMESVLDERNRLLNHLESETAILLAPFLLSARGNVIIREDGWELRPENKLFILYEQERLLGLQSALQYLQAKKERAEQEKKPRIVKRHEQMIERLNTLPLAVQVYLELSQEEEKKLFFDLNTERRITHPGLKMQYDQRNEYTILTRRVANKFEHSMEIDQKLARIRDQSSALTSLSIMQKCSLAMWEGNLDGKETKMNNTQFSTLTKERITEEFYKVWLELFPVKASNRQQYVSGLSGIQIALAYTVFLLTKDHNLTHRAAIRKLLTLKSSCTWQHEDPLFNHLYDFTTERIKNHNAKGSIQETARRFIARITEEVCE